MNKSILLAALIAMAPAGAMAGADGSCGVGSHLFKGQSGVPAQVLAMTTNGTFFQTFAVTTGTSGCTQDGVVKSNWKLSMFIDLNKEKLARDMSRGEGEALDSLAALIGIADEHKPAFEEVTQQNFGTIFSSLDVTAEDILASLKQSMEGKTELAPYAVVI